MPPTLLLPLFSLATLLLFHQVITTVTTPYMDEPFFLDTIDHHQQGHLSYYNPFITTFPGLFLINYPLQKALSLLGMCTLSSGRLISLCLLFLNLYLLNAILRKHS